MIYLTDSTHTSYRTNIISYCHKGSPSKIFFLYICSLIFANHVSKTEKIITSDIINKQRYRKNKKSITINYKVKHYYLSSLTKDK